MPKIPLLADPLPERFLRLLGDRYELFPWPAEPDPDQLRRAAGVITYSHPAVNDALLDRMPNVKVVSNHGVGVDHIDVAACRRRGIPVGNTPGCLDASTADMTIALLLAVARNVVSGDHFARGPEFTHYDPSLNIGQEVTGSSLGIIGLGRIGAEVARRAKAFQMQLFYHNRRRREDLEAELGVKYLPFEELLRTCDFITLNCPLTKDTTGLISAPQFALMKPTAILINLARGGVVNTNDLYTALTTGQIAAAGVDVTDPEPLPRDHPLLSLRNIVITPHLGSASNRTRQRMLEMTVQNLEAGLRSQPLPWSV